MMAGLIKSLEDRGAMAGWMRLLALFILLAGIGHSQAANFIYQIRGGAGSNNIWRVDPVAPASEVQVVGNYPGSPAATLAQCPNGQLFYVNNAANGQVFIWDPAVGGTPTLLGNLGGATPASFRMVCSPGGVLYYLPDSGQLYTINQGNGFATAVPGAVITGLGSGGDMAFDTTGTLYVVNSSFQLFTAPLGGGAAIPLGTITGVGGATIGLEFNSAGTLFTQGQNPSQLYTVNLGSFAATSVVALSGGTTATGDLASTKLASPTIAKAFAPTSILVNGASVLTITLTNPAAVAQTGAAFTDTYPAGLVNTAAPAGATTCGGTVTAAAGGGSVALSGGTIPANGSCTVTVNVTSASGGVYANSIAARALTTSVAYNDAAASATLTVIGPPAAAKSFTPNQILINGTSVLTITLTNPNTTTALTSVVINDTYPVGLNNTATPSPATTCSGATIVGGLAGANSIGITGGSIPATGSCTITVNVTSAATGSYSNTTSNVTSTNGGTGNTANATLTVLNALPPNIAKSFTPATIQTNGTSVLTLVISNPNASAALTGVAVNDTYPVGLMNRLAGPAATPTVTCTAGSGGSIAAGTGLNGGNTIGYSGGSILAGGSCTVTVNVTSAANATYSNTTGNVTSTNGGTGAAAAATLIVQVGQVPPVISKAFSISSTGINLPATLTFTISNPNNSTLFNVAFTDTYPAGLVNAATPNVVNTCAFSGNSGASFTGGVAGGNTIGLSGATGNGGSPNDIPANTTCTLSVDVTSAAEGTYNNTSGAVSGRDSNGNGAATLTGNTASATIVFARPTIAKSFSPTTIASGGTSTLTITLTNPTAVAFTGATFNDVFPTSPGAMTVASPLTTSNTCGGSLLDSGGGALTAGDVGIRLTGGTIPASGSCTITVNVTAAVAGAYNNTIAAGALSTSGGTNAAAANASLTVALPSLTVAKTVLLVSDPTNGVTNPKNIPGAIVMYSIQVTNSGAGTVDNNTTVIVDPIPANTTLFVGDLGGAGSGPVAFVNGVPVSGLTYTFTSLASATDDVSFSNSGCGTFTYTPVPDASGFDSNVNCIRINPKGVFAAASGGNNPNFQARFRVRVN